MLRSQQPAAGWAPREAWQLASLQEIFGDRIFAFGDTDDAEPVLFSLHEYAAYIAADAEEDRNPLYLFDPAFDVSAPEMLSMYTPPGPLCNDPLSPLSLEDRPDWRWLLIGAKRSGSSLHKDPLSTSAWNSLLQGRKRWVMIHPAAWERLCQMAQGGLILPPIRLHSPPCASIDLDLPLFQALSSLRWVFVEG